MNFRTQLPIALLLFIYSFSSGQKSDLVGIWKGDIAGSPMFLEIKNDSVSILRVPMGGLDSLKSKSVSITEDSIRHHFSYMRIQFKVITDLGRDTMSGVFIQNSQSFPISLTLTESIKPERTQIPQPPFNYDEQEISFYNPVADITLSGTLTKPRSKDYPVVILISGSGLQNRNCEIFDHRPFHVIADYFSSRGIAVLRYDERGAGKSEGAYHSATSEDFKNDVLCAVTKLDSMGYQTIGLAGHSEGGLIAPLAATESKKVDFVISLAGPGKALDSMMLIQNTEILKDQGLFSDEEISEFINFTKKVYELIDIETPKEDLYTPLGKLCGDFYTSRDSTVAPLYGPSQLAFYQKYGQMLNPWFRWFINYDPQPTIEKLSCPVLALNGNLDIQVAAEPNLEGYRTALGKSASPSYKVIELDSINHLFQKVATRATSEYYNCPESFNEEVMQLMVDWIHENGMRQ